MRFAKKRNTEVSDVAHDVHTGNGLLLLNKDRDDFSSSSHRHKKHCNKHNFSTSANVQNQSHINPSRVKISFMTDIEGDASYFRRFVQHSKILEFAEDGMVQFSDDHANNNDLKTMLVYGGDICDKGGSDLYVLRQLVSLRERYGCDRVHFILGNRDINKLRITQELGSVVPDKLKNGDFEELPSHGGCYWLKGRETMGDPKSTNEMHKVPTKPSERLKWMLASTMGSPNAFEYRREELKRDRMSAMGTTEQTTDIIVTDDDVVQSYIETCRPDGLMGKYLSYASLAVRIGKILFMHGALPITKEDLSKCQQLQNENEKDYARPFWNDLTFPTPWDTNNDSKNERYDSVKDETLNERDKNTHDATDKWIQKINDFAKNEIETWRDTILNPTTNNDKNVSNRNSQSLVWATEGGYHDQSKKGGGLAQYGMGKTSDGKMNPTIVYATWTSYGMPKILTPPMSPRFDKPQQYLNIVRDFFAVSDIDVIVTGHRPIGDLPLPMRIDYSSNKNIDTRSQGANHMNVGWIISCDTSFSGDTHWINPNKQNKGKGKSLSGRGDVAITEVILEQNLETDAITNIISHGILSDGSSYLSESMIDSQSDCSWVGKIIDRDSFTIVCDNEKEKDGLSDIHAFLEKENLNKWCVKCKLNDDRYIVSSGRKYDVWNAVVSIP